MPIDTTTSLRGRLVGHLAACTLILAAPLLVFMDANHRVWSMETLVLVGCLALLAGPFAVTASIGSGLLTCATYAFLIALFVELLSSEFYMNGLGVVLVMATAFAVLWPLRRHLTPLFGAIFGVFNLATAGIALAAEAETPVAALPQRSDLPPIVHIVLDEQIGLDGLARDVPGGEDLRAWLLSYLEGEGFAVFGRAHSLYFYTRDSVSSALNFGVHETPEGLYSGKTAPYIVRENEYLRRAREKGYSVRIYQTSYLDFCQTPDVAAAYCHTYSQTRPSGAAWDELGVFERSQILARIYGWSSFLAQAVWGAFDAVWRRLHPQNPPPRLQRGQWNFGVAPISALAAFDRLIEDVGKARRGTLYFAHILLPHGPFILDRHCRVQDRLLDWRESFPSTAQARHDRYADYFEQVRCAFRKVGQLLDRMKAAGVFKDAIVVLHGDHGSRIGSSTVDFENRDSLTRRNYLDAYSTLFAIRAPGYARGYHPRTAPLPDLLREFVTGTRDGAAATTDPFVYLTEGAPGYGLRWHRVPFTAFGDAPH